MEKKKMKFWKKILIVIGVIFIILLIAVIRKFMILSHLENISKSMINSNNYYVETYSLQENCMQIAKSYNKENTYLTVLETTSKNTGQENQLTVYDNGTETIRIIQTAEEKIALVGGTAVGGKISVNVYATYGQGFWSKFQLAMLSTITTEKINNRDCYLVESVFGWKKWIDKETGLVIREYNNGDITDFYHEFDVVENSDIQKPDISDCKIVNN